MSKRGRPGRGGGSTLRARRALSRNAGVSRLRRFLSLRAKATTRVEAPASAPQPPPPRPPARLDGPSSARCSRPSSPGSTDGMAAGWGARFCLPQRPGGTNSPNPGTPRGVCTLPPAVQPACRVRARASRFGWVGPSGLRSASLARCLARRYERLQRLALPRRPGDSARARDELHGAHTRAAGGLTPGQQQLCCCCRSCCRVAGQPPRGCGRRAPAGAPRRCAAAPGAAPADTPALSCFPPPLSPRRSSSGAAGSCWACSSSGTLWSSGPRGSASEPGGLASPPPAHTLTRPRFALPPLAARRSPDNAMAFCEEAYKRRQLREGKPYTGKLPVRGVRERAKGRERERGRQARGAHPRRPHARARPPNAACAAVPDPGGQPGKQQVQDAAHREVEDGACAAAAAAASALGAPAPPSRPRPTHPSRAFVRSRVLFHRTGSFERARRGRCAG